MTTTEDRLRAALEARAEQVRTDDLRATAPPVAGRPMQMLTVLAAVAGVLVLIAAGFLTRHLLQGNEPASPTKQPPDTPHRLTGDIDGDGKLDVVRLQGRRVMVDLGGTSRTAHTDLLPRSVLVGLAGLGEDGSAIIASVPEPFEPGSLPSRHAVVLRLVGSRLVETTLEAPADDPVAEPGPLVSDRYDPVWVTEGKLYSAVVVPSHSRGVPVYAWTYALVGGHLRATRLGQMCWNPGSETHPTACRSGHNYDGPAGVLPDLVPVSGSLIGARHSFTDTVRGAPVVVRYVSGPARVDSPIGRIRFSVTVSGTTYSATTPDGFPAGISTELVPGDGGFAIMFRQDVGDAALEKAYVFRDGRLRPARVSSAVPLGEFFVAGTILRTWQTADGGLFTALPIPAAMTPGRVPERMWSWRLTGDRLLPEPLGIVCLPDVVPDRSGSVERCQP